MEVEIGGRGGDWCGWGGRGGDRCLTMCCEILKYSQVYEPYRSIVGQERGRTHKDLNERRKIKSNLNQINPNPV